VRIIGGAFRGRRLAALGKGDRGAHLRPTPDRVRESLFNSLDNWGVVSGARVLDLFAGTGALGLEALSRGAGHVTFVDDGRVAQRLLRDNVNALDVVGRSALLARDATRLGPCTQDPVALVFLDPPYGKGLGPRAVEAAQAGGRLAPEPTLVWEEVAALSAAPRVTVLAQRRHGHPHGQSLSRSG